MLKVLDECPCVREALLGHMAERLQTFANLAGDLAFKDATAGLPVRSSPAPTKAARLTRAAHGSTAS